MEYGKTTNDTLYESSGSWLRFKTSSQPLPIGTIRIGFMVGHKPDHTLKTVDPTSLLTDRGTWTYVGVADPIWEESIEWQSQVWDFNLTVNMTDWSYLFEGDLLMLTDVVGVNIIDANAYGVTTMEGMFKNAYVNNVLSIRNTESCLNTSYMFYSGSAACIAGVHFAVPNCQNASYMFYKCFLLTTWEEPYDRFDFRATGSCTNMSYMFYDWTSYLNANAPMPPPIDMSACTDASYMFYNDRTMKYFPYSTHNVQNMDHMLCQCSKLATLSSDFSTASCTNAASAFQLCRELVNVPYLDLSNCTDTNRMFASCYKVETINISSSCLTTNACNMFAVCHSLKSISLFDTSHATDVSSMFFECVSLTDIPLFDTSNATNGYHFAGYDYRLKKVPLINTSKMTNVARMFYRCYDVEEGALDLYNQMSTQAVPPNTHGRAFESCGRDSTTGAAELAQIPASWGGTAA